jgi:hypothetical protein
MWIMEITVKLNIGIGFPVRYCLYWPPFGERVWLCRRILLRWRITYGPHMFLLVNSCRNPFYNGGKTGYSSLAMVSAISYSIP